MSDKIRLGNSVYLYQNAGHIGPGSDEPGDMAANIVPDGINCLNFGSIRFQINYGDTDSPVGVLSVQVCETGLAADFKDYPLLATMVTVHAGDGVLNSGGTIDISGVGAGRIDLNIKDPFGFLLVKYTSTSDGVADVLVVRVGAD